MMFSCSHAFGHIVDLCDGVRENDEMRKIPWKSVCTSVLLWPYCKYMCLEIAQHFFTSFFWGGGGLHI